MNDKKVLQLLNLFNSFEVKFNQEIIKLRLGIVRILEEENGFNMIKTKSNGGKNGTNTRK